MAPVRATGPSFPGLAPVGSSRPDLPAIGGPSKALTAQTDKAKVKIAESGLAQSAAVSAQAVVTSIENQLGGLKREQKELQKKLGDPFDPAGALDASKKLKDLGKKLEQLETGEFQLHPDWMKREKLLGGG